MMTEAQLQSEVVQLGEGVAFENGETCKGVAYPILTEDGEVDPTRDYAEVEVTRRYPLDGLVYSQNNGSTEEIEVVSGEGYLLRIKTSGYMSRIALRPRVRVTIEKGEVFAYWQTEWDDTKPPLTFKMVCTPPFNPTLYRYVEHHEVVGLKSEGTS